MLVDISKEAKKSGFIVPVAVTERLYHGYLEPDKAGREMGQSKRGRIHDMLTILFLLIKGGKNKEADTIRFSVLFWVNGKEESIRLKSIIGSGDTAAPVLTIMLEGED